MVELNTSQKLFIGATIFLIIIESYVFFVSPPKDTAQKWLALSFPVLIYGAIVVLPQMEKIFSQAERIDKFALAEENLKKKFVSDNPNIDMSSYGVTTITGVFKGVPHIVTAFTLSDTHESRVSAYAAQVDPYSFRGRKDDINERHLDDLFRVFWPAWYSSPVETQELILRKNERKDSPGIAINMSQREKEDKDEGMKEDAKPS